MSSTKRRWFAGALTVGLLGGGGSLLAQPAQAADPLLPDPPSVSGMHSVACDVNWFAEVDASSGYANWTINGFIANVSPGTDPGHLQIQHFQGGNDTMAVRIPIATDYEMSDVTLTVFPTTDRHASTENKVTQDVTLDAALPKSAVPEQMGAKPVTKDDPTPTWYLRFAGDPRFVNPLPAPDNITHTADGFTMHWNKILASSASVFLTSASIPGGFQKFISDPTKHVYIGATLTGTYTADSGAPNCPVPTPTYTPGSGNPGDTVSIDAPTFDVPAPDGTKFEIGDNPPAGVTVTIDGNTGAISVDIPEDYNSGDPLNIPVKITFPFGKVITVDVPVTVNQPAPYPTYTPGSGTPGETVSIGTPTFDVPAPDGTKFEIGDNPPAGVSVNVDGDTGAFTVDIPEDWKPGDPLLIPIKMTWPPYGAGIEVMVPITVKPGATSSNDQVSQPNQPATKQVSKTGGKPMTLPKTGADGASGVGALGASVAALIAAGGVAVTRRKK